MSWDDELKSIALLLRDRNRIDARIAEIVGRPVVHGHLSDWIAAVIFGIEQEPVANRAVDGRFRGGPLHGRTVNVKHYSRNTGLLDMTDSADLDFYLVMTGSGSTAHRPFAIDRVYLFDAQELYDELYEQMRRIGTATSVRAETWQKAEIHPRAVNRALVLTAEQAAALRMFRSPEPHEFD